MAAYATPADLAAYMGVTVPDDAARMLQRASELLDSMVVVPFDIDPVSTLPVDPFYAAALRDAACAQVEFWATTGDEVGELTEWDSISVGNLSLARFAHGGRGQRGAALSPRASAALSSTGLLSGALG